MQLCAPGQGFWKTCFVLPRNPHLQWMTQTIHQPDLQEAMRCNNKVRPSLEMTPQALILPTIPLCHQQLWCHCGASWRYLAAGRRESSHLLKLLPIIESCKPQTGRSPSILGIVKPIWKICQVVLMLTSHFELLWTVLVFLARRLCVRFNGAFMSLFPGLSTAASARSSPGHSPAFLQSTWMEQGSPAALRAWCEAVMFARGWSVNCAPNAGVRNKGRGGKGW